ncbi:adenylate cyclase [Psychromonas sp. CNPT3]|uniref:class I adenylate cyclase n=1 Tax=Psychromonas sp. CNPT3 TaxID=314282 RepID=UPI00006E7115|nr:class I adenylate cyclase [Psychromonas sp. CNPT3]AGH80021.1 adenylate cyclase [Psychromonas sp. CNPT3]
MNPEIKRLRDKADQFNRLRIQSAQVLMTENEYNVFQTFPILLHYNQVNLPGYINSDVPIGICQFQITAKQTQLLSQFLNVDKLYKTSQSCDILGLYAMGSTSSIGQCSHSDFDIWICYPHQIDSRRIQLLNEKATLITAWAETFNVELNFFLIPDNKFRVKNNAGMNSDSCGSSQHMLLLDEFYRTALRVAGKRILWPLIPIDHEKNYNEYVENLYKNKELNENDWLDLGGFYRIPAEEYFGATLWQLYKGIDTPYKAVLKTILMEAYSSEYPNTELVAMSYKRCFQNQAHYDERLDPYCLMLEKVTHYLIKIDDLKRLDVVRACFYLKTEENLSTPCHNNNTAWRRTILNRFINQWQWDENQILDLDNHLNWKVCAVEKAQNVLLDALMISYRKLHSFARRNNISESISVEDLGILSRKLYAAHEKLPGKIDLINANGRHNLSEPDLSFIQVPENRKSNNAPGWYLYNSSLDNHSLINTPLLMHSQYLSKLIAWCHFNGLYKKQTQLYLYNQGSDLMDAKLNQFMDDLHSIFPLRIAKATNKALTQPCEIKHLAIFLNVEKDPTQHWQDTTESNNDEIGNVLSYGINDECLIGSIDLIYRNSWNEVRTLHFNSNYSVVEALNTLLGKMHQDAKQPEKIEIFSYSRHFKKQLSDTFLTKLQEFIQLRLTTTSRKSLQTLWTGGKKFGFYFERTGVSLQHLESSVDIYSHISEKKVSSSAINLRNTHFEQTVEMIESHLSEGLIQFFFENHEHGFNVYIANVDNEIETFQHFSGNKDDLVKSVNRFYASNRTQSDNTNNTINFSLPQFYDIQLEAQEGLSLRSFKGAIKNQ